MKIAVITGASSGMGREFVRELTAEQSFDEVWVIARRKDRLEALQSEISVPIRAVALDLSDSASIAEYRRLLDEVKPEVKVLVNASGFGRFEAFENGNLETYYNMIDLNDKAMVGMTYETLPFMKKGGQIYQICSRAAVMPVPYINIYAATKAFTLSFSRALNVELKKKGIRVLGVCPFWTKTEFFDRAVDEDCIITYYSRYTTAEQVVSRAIKDMKRGRDISVPGFMNRVEVFATKLLPARWAMAIWCKQQKIK